MGVSVSGCQICIVGNRFGRIVLMFEGKSIGCDCPVIAGREENVYGTGVVAFAAPCFRVCGEGIGADCRLDPCPEQGLDVQAGPPKLDY